MATLYVYYECMFFNDVDVDVVSISTFHVAARDNHSHGCFCLYYYLKSASIGPAGAFHFPTFRSNGKCTQIYTLSFHAVVLCYAMLFFIVIVVAIVIVAVVAGWRVCAFSLVFLLLFFCPFHLLSLR